MAKQLYKSLDLHHLDEETMEGAIVNGIIEDDFYKFPMGEFIRKNYRNVNVGWQFKNRTTGIRLAEHITEKAFMDQIALCDSMGLDSRERHFIGGTYEYDTPMFSNEYMEELTKYKLPVISYSVKDGQPDIRWNDKWNVSSPVEMPVLKIVNTLYFRSILSKLPRIKREAIYAEGILRLSRKIALLQEHPYVNFSDFGNRRAFSPAWHDFVVARLFESFPETQFKGTSKTSLAMKYGGTPVGTCAHEISMVIAALMFDGSEESLMESIEKMHQQWYGFYGKGLAISLPDTFGTQFTVDALSNELIRKTRGFRIDSMDPMQAIPLLQKRYQKAGVDYRERLFIPSDGLTVESAIAISSKFKGLGKISHGIGTHLTNDLGLTPISIVCKAVSADGIPCVKLSDNIAKAIGEPKMVDAYKKAAGYNVTFNEATEV